jgi:hypothetical protein
MATAAFARPNDSEKLYITPSGWRDYDLRDIATDFPEISGYMRVGWLNHVCEMVLAGGASLEAVADRAAARRTHDECREQRGVWLT